MLHVGVRIKYLRQRQYMPIRVLSERSGVSISAIVDAERGIRTPWMQTIEDLCTGLGVTMEQLFALEVPQEFIDKHEKSLANAKPRKPRKPRDPLQVA